MGTGLEVMGDWLTVDSNWILVVGDVQKTFQTSHWSPATGGESNFAF